MACSGYGERMMKAAYALLDNLINLLCEGSAMATGIVSDPEVRPKDGGSTDQVLEVVSQNCPTLSPRRKR